MKEFINNLTSTSWGVGIIIIFFLALLVLVSIFFYKQFFKRFYDFLLSILALVVLAPILFILTVFGAIKMKGNPFFTQMRPGRMNKKTGKEKIFKLIKFRTMTSEKDANGKLLPDEVRLTKYGKFLRNTSLDELPELINILKGDMSIIGPRPQLVRDMVFMTNEQRRRHTVRPGLSGKAQISGRNAINWEDKLACDLVYIDHITLLGDIALIIKTIFKVFKREGITEEGMATAEDYGDYLLRTGKVKQSEYDKKQDEAIRIIKNNK